MDDGKSWRRRKNTYIPIENRKIDEGIPKLEIFSQTHWLIGCEYECGKGGQAVELKWNTLLINTVNI